MSRALQKISPWLARTIVALALAHLLAVMAMTASPQLHEWIHHDAAEHDHECSVTDMLSGGFGGDASPTPLIVAAILPQQFCSVAEFDPQWVASLFLTSRVLEHAPPVIS